MSGRTAVAVALFNVAVGALPVGFVVATSVLIGRAPAAVSSGLHSAQWRSLVAAFIVASTFFFAQQLLTPLSVALGQLMKHRVDGQFHDRLMEVSLRSPGIEPLENQTNLANLHKASEALETGFRTPGDAAAGTLALVVRYTRLIGFGAVIGFAFSWWAAAGICLVTMTFRLGQRECVRMYSRIMPTIGPLRRERDYYRGIALASGTAKELRVFGLADWIVGCYRDTAMAALVPLWKERRRVSVRSFLWFTMAGLVVACLTLGVVVHAAARGSVTLTGLSLTLQAAVGAILLGEFYHEADTATQFGMLSARAIDDLDKHVDAGIPVQPSTALAADSAGHPVESIVFCGVSFRYPGQSRPVLDELQLTLPAGACTALVGLNGAGKTTVVKLLARLYEPTEGVILADGRDIREFSVDAWRRQLGIIFQDFNRYEFSAVDNIAFGAIEQEADLDSVLAAARKAGVADALNALPLGPQTVLARHYEGGAELSGGQWQRVAIARALYAVEAGAKLLVLDEPTAALDVRAEAQFFAEFGQTTRGVTTLLISHRFSSVRHADHIVVLASGKVVEAGTHESLLACDGRYAELFRMQAERFTDRETAGLFEKADVEADATRGASA